MEWKKIPNNPDILPKGYFPVYGETLCKDNCSYGSSWDKKRIEWVKYIPKDDRYVFGDCDCNFNPTHFITLYEPRDE